MGVWDSRIGRDGMGEWDRANGIGLRTFAVSNSPVGEIVETVEIAGLKQKEKHVTNHGW